jgi:hypothetical protein
MTAGDMSKVRKNSRVQYQEPWLLTTRGASGPSLYSAREGVLMRRDRLAISAEAHHFWSFNNLT